MLVWARERARASQKDLVGRFLKLESWERGEAAPTLKQLERFAKATYTPVGYFFLPEPPVERVPIPDFRTIQNRRVERPSPNLLETIYLCQQRQAWYKEYARSMREVGQRFVGSIRVGSSVEAAAATMREALGFELDARRDASTWTEALRQFIAQADESGVLVICSGVVLNNNHRQLDPEEFRGFALADELAPVVSSTEPTRNRRRCSHWRTNLRTSGRARLPFRMPRRWPCQTTGSSNGAIESPQSFWYRWKSFAQS
jgi:transcriptional regulator with XRE-family HTH domain